MHGGGGGGGVGAGGQQQRRRRHAIGHAEAAVDELGDETDDREDDDGGHAGAPEDVRWTRGGSGSATELTGNPLQVHVPAHDASQVHGVVLGKGGMRGD